MKIIALIFFLGPSLSYASLTDLFPSKENLSKRLTPKSAKNCEDFSGNWEGFCLVDGNKEEVKMGIGQFGCNAWFLNEYPDFLYLNGSKQVIDTDFVGPNAPFENKEKWLVKLDGDEVSLEITQEKSTASEPVFWSKGIIKKLSKNSIVSNSINSNGTIRACTLKIK